MSGKISEKGMNDFFEKLRNNSKGIATILAAIALIGGTASISSKCSEEQALTGMLNAYRWSQKNNVDLLNRKEVYDQGLSLLKKRMIVLLKRSDPTFKFDGNEGDRILITSPSRRADTGKPSVGICRHYEEYPSEEWSNDDIKKIIGEHGGEKEYKKFEDVYQAIITIDSDNCTKEQIIAATIIISDYARYIETLEHNFALGAMDTVVEKDHIQ